MAKDIWMSKKWVKNPKINISGRRTGLRMRYENNVSPEIKNLFKEMASWIRQRFFFPVRVPVYIKSKRRIKSKDGDLCVSTSLWPYDYAEEPYIRIATGDYEELVKERGKLQANIAILLPLLHELTHYFQWINSEKLTLIGEERQASRYANDLMEEYLEDKGLLEQIRKEAR